LLKSHITDNAGRTAVDVGMERRQKALCAIIDADPRICLIQDMCELGHLLLVIGLLKQGCPPTFRDERHGKMRQTPLMAAAAGGSTEVVRLLLRRNEVLADKDYQDDLGRTALMRAAGAGALEVTRLLLTVGCDRNLKDNRGLTARDYAGNHSYSVLLKYVSQTMIR
jgi:ankyrin repeat protein